jgi:hypothetical protein
LVSFALYFTAWHAASHFTDLRHLNLRRVLGRAALGCLVSWAAIVIFAWATARWVAPEGRWALVFGFLSAVTAPHMVVVARAHLSPRRAPGRLRAPSWSERSGTTLILNAPERPWRVSNPKPLLVNNTPDDISPHSAA